MAQDPLRKVTKKLTLLSLLASEGCHRSTRRLCSRLAEGISQDEVLDKYKVVFDQGLDRVKFPLDITQEAGTCGLLAASMTLCICLSLGFGVPPWHTRF